MAILSSENKVKAAGLGHPQLVQKLITRIEREGPITFADFMESALYDPEFGYYNSAACIGAGGEYWTSSEFHLIIAQTIALQLTHMAGSTAPTGPFSSIEMGAGRGTCGYAS